MQRAQLEDLIRAATAITGATEWIVVKSQAILGEFPHPPEELLRSVEADVFSTRSAADTDLVEGSIGEGSPFHQTFGYYAHGVGDSSAVLPAGWRDRLVALRNENTGDGTGLCLEVHDLAVSKLVAGREKDLAFVAALLRHGLAKHQILKERLALTPLSEEHRNFCVTRLERLSGKLTSENFPTGDPTD